MRTSAFIAAALPLGISAMPAPAIIEDRGLINNMVCIPYNIIVNNLLADPLLVPFCKQFISVGSSTVAKVVGSSAAPVTVTSPVTINGGGPVTLTSMATVTAPTPAGGVVTNWVTVSVTSATSTTSLQCLASAYAAPTLGKRAETGPVIENPQGKRSEEASGLGRRLLGALGGILGSPAPAPATNSGPTPAPVNGGGLLGGLLGGTAPAPVKGANTGPVAGSGPAPAPAPVKVASSAPAPVASSIPRPSCIPSDISADIIAIICNCANIPNQVTTVSVSQLGGAASTVTLMPTTTINAVATFTTTSTSTFTPAAANAKTVVSTTTTTIGSVATSIASTGLVYRKYTSNFSGYSASANFNSDWYKSVSPDFTGKWSTLNFMTPGWPYGTDSTLQLDQPQSFDVSQAALLFMGFFIAPQTGAYTFTTPGSLIDNYGEFWTGSSAYGWADKDAAYKAIRTNNDEPKTGTTTVTLNAGDAMPFSYLWANGGGPGRNAFNIAFPDGTSPSDLSKYFAAPCSTSSFV